MGRWQSFKDWVLRKPKGDGITRFEYRNYNSSNTCIDIAVFDGGVVGMHVSSPNPENAEKLYFKVKNDLLKEIDMYRKKRGIVYAT